MLLTNDFSDLAGVPDAANDRPNQWRKNTGGDEFAPLLKGHVCCGLLRDECSASMIYSSRAIASKYKRITQIMSITNKTPSTVSLSAYCQSLGQRAGQLSESSCGNNSGNEFCHALGPSEAFDVNVNQETFDKLTQWSRDYGDVIAIRPAKRKDPALILNNPEQVKQVLVSHHHNYKKGVGFERVAMMLGNGLIVSSGDFWRSQRRMVQPSFHRNMVARHALMMQRCNRQKLTQWLSKAAIGETIDITAEMSELALEVILRALFSDDFDSHIVQQGDNPFSFLVEDFTRDLKVAVRFRALTKLVAKIMSKRREEHRIEHDFLSMLMESRDKDTNLPMTDKALIDEVMTLIVAGHETTSGSLNWTWYLLSQHEEVESRLHKEVDTLDNDPGTDDMAKLSYTRAILDETLRLYPPVWLFSRKATGKDSFVNDNVEIEISAGTDVFLCPYLLHRNERYWSDPQTFAPDRFLGERSKQINPNAYYPFSLGSRRCIGEYFSLVEMQLHIALLAKYIRLKPVSADPVKIDLSINLRSRGSIMMMPVARSQ